VLETKSFETTSAEISFVPEAPVTLDNDATAKTLRLIEKLEDNDDVQNVYSNIEVPDSFEDE
jgi:transcriptional/translational regulatory protein YebC/TACO1